MPVEWLLVWTLTGLRALGVVMLLPVPGGKVLPAMLRVACAFMFPTLLAGIIPHAPMPEPPGWPWLAEAAVREMVLGLALGFVGRLVFAGAELAGRLIANELGLVAAPGFDVPTPSQEPLPAFIGSFAGLMFFLMGGHEGALAAFVRSFDFAPAGAARFSVLAGETLTICTAQVIEFGMRMAAPFIALNFVISLAFSILGRAVPRMNVFIISYPVRTLVGLSLLAGAGGLFGRYLWRAMDALPWTMLELVGRN
ncbi:type III secretion protein [Opitutaceae bacterium TAV4]|uniref:flagellar biosynthetic protein FliR n=1 Tax=Geminisphaera colitermitum TaxID=1148786 RepID=UPI000158CAD1|nr:flagellar biosynthetic protein FliR [Geminisphaera colitermitum]RRJ98008.1 type III secretion protein [Opitutaceae bacterium TAV4]RRK02608.1 type III secretion protein [Opitutaceae bacterium TAV3]